MELIRITTTTKRNEDGTVDAAYTLLAGDSVIQKKLTFSASTNRAIMLLVLEAIKELNGITQNKCTIYVETSQRNIGRIFEDGKLVRELLTTKKPGVSNNHDLIKQLIHVSFKHKIKWRFLPEQWFYPLRRQTDLLLAK